MLDFTRFFSPAAWGSWAPPSGQSMLPPQAQPGAAPAPPGPAGSALAGAAAGGAAGNGNPQPNGNVNYNGLFNMAAQMVNNNQGAPAPLGPLRMPQPAGLGMLSRLGAL